MHRCCAGSEGAIAGSPRSGLPLERYSLTVETDCFAALKLHKKASDILDITAAQALIEQGAAVSAQTEAQ